MNGKDIHAALETQLQSATGPWDRLPILIELASKITPHNPHHAYIRAEEALTLAKELNDQFWIASSLLAIGITLRTERPRSEVLHYLQQASQMFSCLNTAEMKAQANFRIAHVFIEMGKFAEAVTLLTECLAVFKQLKAHYWIARTWCFLGDTCKWGGDPVQAITYYRRAISLGLKAGLDSAMGGFYQSIADLYNQLGDTEQYRKYLFKSLTHHQKTAYQMGQGVVMSNIANLYISRGWYRRAEPYVRRSMKIYQDLGCTPHEGMNWARMGAIYANKKDLPRTVACYKKAFILLRNSEETIFIGKLYETFGIVCMETGRASSGIRYLKKSLSIIRTCGYPLYEYQIHHNLADAYEAIGDSARALKHFKEYNRIKGEYVSNRKSLEAGRVEMKGYVQTLSEQLCRERSRANSLKETIEAKEAELVSLTLSLVQKGEDEKSNSLIKENGTIPKDEKAFSENWDIFAQQFHKVHHGFYSKLVERFPELSLTEIKVCSLIRIGLSSKEIAAILCISKRTADSHREHIHKKLRLEPGTLLATFIAAI